MGVCAGDVETRADHAAKARPVGGARTQLCKAKGYFCEFCRSKEIIYPFDFATTVRCNDCRSLAHKKCYNRATCPKCARIARVAKQASERTPI